ncbi:unnamed protein product [Echinostoma caproni]|uniref:VWFD domain-containing protein n=1 Tax=Echinostoma caproni TaxID=27848 RepID=A0A183AB62_9TREM|nr:unnamed protein product [Echinostoma caproni]
MGGQERWYANDFLKKLLDLFVSSNTSKDQPVESQFIQSNHIVMDSSIFIPTIGGFPVEIKYLILKNSRKDIGNQFSLTPDGGQLNRTSSTSIAMGTQLKINTFQRHWVINQWYQVLFDANLHGLVRYTSKPDRIEGHIYLNDWDNEQLAFNYQRDHYAILDGETIPSGINHSQMTLFSQTPTYIDTLLGLSASSRVMLVNNSSELLPIQINLCVNRFRGLDAQFVLERGGEWLGSVGRLFLLFTRPGELDSNEVPKKHLELLFEVGPVNQTAQFVEIRFVPPWQHELDVRAEYSQNGVLHAVGNLSLTPWEVYGVYVEEQDQQKFTAKIHYPSGMSKLAFRGNLTGNFKLQVNSADNSWPVPIQMTQRVINSRHTHYPSFRRFHHETQLQLRDKQSLILQLEWNTGRRNGRLEQGVVRLKQTNDQGRSELRSAITWTEGDAASQLDKQVQGYSRQLTVETKIEPQGSSP